VVVVLERVRRTGDEVTVLNRQVEDRFGTELDPGETWTNRHAVVPTLAGELRIRYLLYRGEPPEQPAPENAYRALHVWTEVPTDPGAE